MGEIGTLRTCIGCEATFAPHPRERNRRKWCSERCRSKAMTRRERTAWTPEQRARDNEAKKWRRYAREFGVSPEDYERLLEAQGGVCALCRKPAKSIKLALDHCHETGAVRGILCTSCNTALGRLGDTADALRAVVAYLENSPAQEVPDGR